MKALTFERKEQYGLERFFPIEPSEVIIDLKTFTNGRKCFSAAELSGIRRFARVMGFEVKVVIKTAAGTVEV